MSIYPASWITHPSSFEMLDTMTVTISNNYQSFKCSKYSMNLVSEGNAASAEKDKDIKPTDGTGQTTTTPSGGNSQNTTPTVEKEDPYAIKTANDLKKLTDSSETYYLKNDIDMAGAEWTPITGFTGTLNGNGFSIKNLTINSDSSNVGLFAVLEGTVNNLKIESANITVTGRKENIGILCGELKGSVTNITVSGIVDAPDCTNVGGIAGYLYVQKNYTVTNLKNNAAISGANYVGGIIGGSLCDNSGSSSDRTIELSKLENTGVIRGKGDYVGGIAGCFSHEGYISTVTLVATSMKNTGNIIGTTYVGGIFGNIYSDSSKSYIQDCTNISVVTGECYVGCIAGSAKNVPISDCINAGSELNATGHITVDGVKYAYVGGYVGYGYTANNCTNEVEINYSGSGRYVGGIIGYAHIQSSCTMTDLRNNAAISGASYVGGIIGGSLCNNSGSSSDRIIELSECENTATIHGQGDYVGGIVGCFSHEGYISTVTLYVSNFSNSGEVTGESYVGGLLGYVKTDSQKSSILGSTSSTGNIAGYIEGITVE